MGPERLVEARTEGRDDGGLLRHRSAAERRPDDREALHEELREVDLAPRAAHEPDQDEAPTGGQRGQVLLEVRRADVIEDHVDAASTRELAGARGEVLPAIVDTRTRAELHAPGALLRAAGGDEAAETGLAQEDDRRGPHPAAAAVDERGLTLRDRPETGQEEVREGGEENLRERPGLLVAHRVRDGEDGAVMDDRLLGVPSTCQERHDALAGFEVADPRSHLGHLAGTFEPEDRRGAGGWRIQALPLQEIGPVDGGRADADADLVVAQRGSGGLARDEHALVARLRRARMADR